METITLSFNNFLEQSLNEHQLQAVTLPKGALLVIAGAGSGKTRVITARIANLMLNHAAAPSSIIALTFTNKAAGEMKERVGSFIGNTQALPFVGTFHSYCLSLLRNNALLLPFPNFTIIDADDQASLIKKIVKQNNLEKFATPSQISFQISSLKNSAFQNSPSPDIHPILREIYYAYEREKASSCCFDFDDLILEVLKLFKQNKDFKQRFQSKVRHILVDEYQDTSTVQHQLLKEMTLTPENGFAVDSLSAVGDEDQSIYSWRGATVANMLKFQHDFKPVSIIKIEQNYRSVKPILDAANSVITNNKLRNPKELWSTRKASNRILHLSCRSGEQEAEIIGSFLKQLPTGKKLSDVAILYRTHFQSRLIEESLIYHSIPYKIIGGIRFYERKEIKDLLAYLRLIINPFDKISLLRIINYPARGLGQQFEMLLLSEWNKNPLFDFKQLLNYLCSSEEFGITTKKLWSLKSFVGIYEDINPHEQPSRLLKHILEKTDYLNHVRTSYDSKEADSKLENIQEFMQSIVNYEHSHTDTPSSLVVSSTNAQPTLEHFLYEVALMQEKTDKSNHHDQVQMMTLHAAKGLEFDTVIIAGLEEGLLPSSRSLNTSEELEEERRLFYVGITRAKERLLLITASYRNTYGNFVDQAPSRFSSEITQDLVTAVNVENGNSVLYRQIFSQWVNNASQLSGLKTFGSSTIPAAKKVQPVSQPRSAWNKNDKVRHKTFGVGIITLVEKANNNDYYITAIFKAGKKKVLSSFLQKE